MRTVVLGTAAGGGFPQWNCACQMCRRAGEPGVPARTQDGLAVSADGTAWYLLNASPDLRAQILATPALRAGPDRRDTPVRGVLLTDAELDHTLGLVTLREASNLRVWAPEPALRALSEAVPVRQLLDSYASWSWHPVTEGDPLTLSGLLVRATAVSGKRPRYAADAPEHPGWVVAYRIEDEVTGGCLVYAPCLAAWPAGFDNLLHGADMVIVDGTFHSADELLDRAGRAADPGAGVSSPMGHLPVTGPGGTIDEIARRPGPRWVYTHLNNTNPLLAAGSPQRAAVTAVGAEVLDDGSELVL